ncbi:MAG: glycosyltransferase family 2 protein [Methyloversatilis discipulorum]|uniref:glycosyltransferase family 2 protein n=1 Tax=Methyloversatilis discipulorum TaxID=1119528 RepID=UPI0026F227FB|nr:glycosyltransferase family 2 protein [Methyloversatilis discipulorum]MBV5287128.1 glycosyltransferase family 2 protein [Methyloversatilis discipulorum]
MITLPTQMSAGSICRVSICIPAFNGYAHLKALIEELLALPRHDFEIVVSDDVSSDQTWPFIEELAGRDRRLRAARNEVNLGMDRNFAHVASLARGEHLWFSGQDDLIQADGLERVLDFLAGRPEIDFILMNHAKRVAGRFGEHMVEASHLEQHVFGVGLQSYVTHTRHHLPTFLPTFLIRSELWRSVDVSRYFGTCYCQVGVFLEASRDIRWCHFAGNHVIGLLPPDGWQSNPSAYVKIAFGHFAMLVRAAARAPWVTRDMLHAFFLLQKRRLVYSFMLLRHHRLQIDPALVEEVTDAVRPFDEIARPAAVVRRAPRVSSSLALGLIESRRALRALLKARRSA